VTSPAAFQFSAGRPDAMSGRLASKSTPMHVFKSDSPCADRKAAGKNCKSKKERAFSVRTLRRRPHVFHRETSSSFVYSDRRQRRKAGLAYFIWKLFA